MKLICALLLATAFWGCASEEVARIENEMTPVAPPAVATEPAKVPVKEVAAPAEEEALTKYSDLNNMAPPSDRQYKRMTRQRMEEESSLNSSAGSLWNMEGQTSYLFAENKHRREGDATSIKLEGSALKSIENKAYVISDLLVKLEEQKRIAEDEAKKAAEQKARLAQVEAEKKLRAERIAKGEIVVDPLDEASLAQEEEAALEAARNPASVPAASANAKKVAEDKLDLKEVEIIPVRIVERRADNTYRVRGQQFLTIKKRPYKVIATGLVRAEDFKDDGVSSNKLLEAQYDVVHMKRVNNE